MPPFLLKEKVAPKVQADFDAVMPLTELFFYQNRHLLKNSAEHFRLNSLPDVDDELYGTLDAERVSLTTSIATSKVGLRSCSALPMN